LNAYSNAQKGYGKASAQIRTPKGLEFEAFARVTRKLKLSFDNPRTGYGHLAEALFENRRLWNLLAGEVAQQDNALPQGLRSQIFYLSEFTNHHSRKVLSNTATLGALIEVNVAIMRGLKKEGE